MDVSIEKMNLKYGDFHAVKDVNLSIEDGRSLVLLGPSGCGKTSTMRTIAGLETPSSGRISIGDKEVFSSANRKNIPPNKRNIGMVFQSYAVWPHKTVRQNVEYALKVKRTSKKELQTRTDHFLELTGLTPYESRGASQLSGGQMQRVALARSLVMNPSVLLLDEPLSNLDALLRETLRNELRLIQKEAGITSVYVTHDQGEALALADEIALMRHGKIVQLGSPEDLYENPVDKEAARFMGFENIMPVSEAETDIAINNVYIGDTEDQAGAKYYLCQRARHVETLDVQGGLVPGAIRATVDLATYQGDHIEYECIVEDRLRVRSRSSASTGALSKGSEVQLVFSKEGERLLKKEETDGKA